MKLRLGSMSPLQPLADQHDTAAKVDALMALCDRVEAGLTATTRSKLVTAALHKALQPAVEVVNA